MTETSIARPLPFASAFATAALLAACGGGGGGTSAPPSNSGGGENCMNGPYGTTCTPTGTTFGGAGGGNYVANTLVSDNTATQALHHDASAVCFIASSTSVTCGNSSYSTSISFSACLAVRASTAATAATAWPS